VISSFNNIPLEGITAQLNHIKEENIILHQRIQSLDSSLEDLRLKNHELTDEILKKTGNDHLFIYSVPCFPGLCRFCSVNILF